MTPERSIAAGPTGATARGTTLFELLAVLLIVSALAALATASLGGLALGARDDSTLATLATLRTATVGGDRASCDFLHDVGHLPADTADLLRRPAADPPWDPALHHGWRGPYVRGAVGVADDATPRILDCWQRPILLQIPDLDGNGVHDDDERRHARYVSLGPDGRLSTPAKFRFPSQLDCGDDVVVYLFVADQRLPDVSR